MFDLFFAVESGRSDHTGVERAVAVYADAVERVLGAASGSVTLVEPEVLRAWFTSPGKQGEDDGHE